MNYRLSILLLAFALCLPARAQYVTASVTFTNPPATGDVFYRNGASAQWTNGPASSTIWIQTNGPTGSATNLWRFLGANNPSLYTRMTSPTNVTISGAGLSVTSSPYAVVVLTTNIQTNNIIVTVPLSNQSATNATNIASQLLTGIDTYASNAFRMSANAMSNFVSRTNAQTVTHKVLELSHLNNSPSSNTFFTNITRANIGSLRGTNVVFDNGSATNFTVASSPSGVFTNLNAYGGTLSNFIAHTLTVTNFSSPGDAAGSQQIGSGATASGVSSSAFGQNSSASQFGSAFGYTASASEGAVAVGQDTSAYTNSVAIGNTTSANALNAVAIGPSSISDYAYSGAYGPGASTTATNQIVLGGATYHVSIPGELRNSKQTNVWNTGTNRFDLAVAFSRSNITTLANGVNLIDPGLKTYLKVSGPSAGYSIDKIQRGWDGRILVIQKNDAFTLTIANESGSGGGTDADRILTGTGGNVTITNAPGFVELIYDSAASRWGVKSKSN